MPIDRNCPKCGKYLTQKELYGKPRIKCSNEKCDYVEKSKDGKTDDKNS